MSECTECHGKGKIQCPDCKGEKKAKCKRCNGHGRFKDCNVCGSTGKITCSFCGGSGKETKDCPVCLQGKVTKTRWINCAYCHGKGVVPLGGGGHRDCPKCGGRGQVKEAYKEICPNCHGEYKRTSDKPCEWCEGTGKMTCGPCGGTGHAKCKVCDGTGKTKCGECDGEGEIKCPTCEAREKRIAEKKRIAENERIEARRKEDAAAAKAKDRKETMQGCGCLIGLLAGAAFLVWWWMEGWSSEFLKEFPSKVDAVLQGRWWMVAVVFAAVAIVYRLAARGENVTAAKSTKKRWLFVVLGLLFGWLGVHLAYAKRWFLFLLLWAGFITGGTLYEGTPQTEGGNDAHVASGTVEQTGAANPFQGNSRYGAIGFCTWALLWICGALFIRKDGKGNRM